MSFIYLSPKEQLILVLYSLIVGVSVGAVYSISRFLLYFTYMFFNRSGKCAKAAEIILDILFSIVYTVIVILFIYGANNGAFRYFLLLNALIGFMVYIKTVSKVLNKIMSKAAFLMHGLIIKLYGYAVYVLKLIINPIVSVIDEKLTINYLKNTVKK